jgi:hypothetical protein
MRIQFRDDRVLLGPVREQQLDVLSKFPELKNHGVCVFTEQNGVDIWATFPRTCERIKILRDCILRYSHILN